MRCQPNGARDYFDRIPEEWDALYTTQGRFSRLADRFFRKALFQRRHLTLAHCGEIGGARVLDIGCGTGQYCLELARHGAAEVIGIDFAPSMVEYSRCRAQEAELDGICQFVRADFLSHEFSGTFNIVIAVGLFDYVDAPALVLRKIAGITAGRFLASFPRYSPLWSLQRKVRYRWIKHCPIHDYTRDQLEKLYTGAGFASWEIIPMKRGFFVVAQNNSS